MGRPVAHRAPGEDEYRVLVARKLDAVRRHRDIRQATIAHVLGATEATVSKWMAGQTTPALYDLVRITTVLDVPLAVIVDPDATANDATLAAIVQDEARAREEAEAAGSVSTPSAPDPARQQPAPGDRTRRP